MHPDTASAVAILQDRLRSAEGRDFRRAERFEAALNDLVRNPGRSGPVGHLVRNASSYGLKRSRRRAQLAPRYDPPPRMTADGPVAPAEVLVTDDRYAHLDVEVRDLIARARLTPFERHALTLLADGASTAEVAASSGVALSVAQVRVSRARAKARAAA